MEKISGIIPANPRHTTVDLKNSGTARAGTPAFGREVGVSSIAVRNMERDLAARSATEHQDLMSSRTPNKTDPHVNIIKNMSDSFFLKRKEEIESPVSVSVEQRPVTEVGEFDVKKLANGQQTLDEAPIANDEDAPIMGGHLDVRV